MPEARQQPDDGNVAELLCKAALVASQRDIDIIPEPCPHGDMPAPPEIGNTVGQKRIVEVFQKSEPQHPSKADGHVGIAGKVEIDLETVGDDTQPCRQYRGSSLRGCCLPQKADVICQQHLFPDAAGEALYSLGKEVSGAVPVLQLVRYRLVADDGARNQLRK